MRRKIFRYKFKLRTCSIWPCAVARKLAAGSGCAAVNFRAQPALNCWQRARLAFARLMNIILNRRYQGALRAHIIPGWRRARHMSLRTPTLMFRGRRRSSAHFASKILKRWANHQWNMSKSYSVWQRFNDYGKCVPDGRWLLLLNMDETSVCRFQGEGKWDVFFSKTASWQAECQSW